MVLIGALTILVVIVLTLVIAWYCIYFKYRKLMHAFPEVGNNVPLLGITSQMRNTVDVYNVTLKYAQKLSKNIFTMVGPLPMLVTSDPEVFALIFGSPKHINKPPIYTTLHNLTGNSLLLTNGDVWRNQRKLLNPGLDYINVKQNINAFNSRSDNLVKVLADELNAESTELDSLIETWALHQTYDTMMGYRPGVKDKEMKKEFLEAIKCGMKIAVKRIVRPTEYYNITYVFTRNFWLERKMVKTVHQHVKNIVAERKQDISKESNMQERPILIDILLRQQQSDASITDDFIIRQLTLMIGAGFDTTSSAISLILYNLAVFPHIQKKAYEELHSIFGDDINQFITHQHITEMTYLDLVIKESLRMSPPVPLIARRLDEDVKFQNTTLPKGLAIIFSIHAMHMNPEVYPEPEKFIPERFTKENLNANRYSFGAFCGGIRNCIGQKYAMLSMKVVLAKIILNYELVDVNHKLCLAAEITLRSKTGVRIGIRRRNVK